MTDQQQLLTVPELARLSGRHEKTIRRAILAGRLPADVDTVSGQYRITREAAFALYPPKDNGATDTAEVAEIELAPEPERERDHSEPPIGWQEGYSMGLLDSARSIVKLDYSPELWAALRAVLA